jgi:putative glutamine amidotransferase
MYRNKRPYMQAIESAGGWPILIPLYTHLSDVENLLPRLDGLLFAGGADIQPGFYREQQHPALNAVDPQLDNFEIALVTWALQRDMAILGICRGMQLINVVLGGTLYQDIPTQLPGSLEHWRRDVPRTEQVHRVVIEEGSLTAQILQTHQLNVNSLHHQAIKDSGKGVRICGWADDGLAEFLEVPGYRFVLGVQSHPEELHRNVPAFARLFRAFINSCSRPSIEPIVPFLSTHALQVRQLTSVRDRLSVPITEKGHKVLKAS